MIVARVEIEVELDENGDLVCNTKVSDPVNEPDLPPLITVLGALDLSRDSIMHIYMEGG